RAQVRAILLESAALSPAELQARASGFVSRLVALFPPHAGARMSAEALDRFVEFLSCPGLPDLIDSLARVLP
ncbi:MAG TPA: hypothetical protein PLD23_05600, partial [Armatimonadota bacterium]|nr:hypothetical protein [Armatimonadota bacterium]